MSWLRKSFLDVGKYKVHRKSGYKVHRGYVKVVCALLLLYLSFAFFWGMTHERYYLVCEGETACLNPLYLSYCNNCGIPDYLFDMEYLPAGFEGGYNPPSILKDAAVWSFILLGFAFVAHHLAYNKNFMREKNGGSFF